ncbi:hypothetical protein ACWD4G_22905 [Streptomyces sp. NPDC002643]
MNTGRRSVAVAMLAGALAVSVLNAPAAQAADTGIKVTNLVINNGKPIVVGTSKVVEPPVTFFVTLPAGYSTADPSRYDTHPFLYHGTTAKKAAESGENYIEHGPYTCYELDSQRARCEGGLYIDPKWDRGVDSNSDATTWKIAVALRTFKKSGPLIAEEYETRSGTVAVKRAAKVTANAAPEPVVKGKKITVTGKLTRANWSTDKFGPYSGRTVTLQFRAKGTNSFKAVKKVTTSSTGALKTTVTASTDGSFRWVYYGNSTTGTATSAADYVDVR